MQPWSLRSIKAGGVADRLAELRRRVAVGDDVEPVAVAAVLGDAALVRREQNAAVAVADALNLDEPQVAGVKVEAGDVVAEVLLVTRRRPGGPATCSCSITTRMAVASVSGLAAAVGPRALPFGVGQDEDRRDPFDGLKRERPLLLEFLPAAVAAGQQLGVPRLGLRQAAFRPLRVLLDLGGGPADLLVGLWTAVRSAKARRGRRSVPPRRAVPCGPRRGTAAAHARGATLRLPAGAPRRAVGSGDSAGVKLPRTAGSRWTGSCAFGELHGEEPFVDDVPEAIHDAGAVEVEAGRRFVMPASRSTPPS